MGVRVKFLFFIAAVLAAALASLGATAPTVNVQFYWERCPQVGEFGLGMGEAVAYRLYQSSNDGPEEMVAVTTDTLINVTVAPGAQVKFRVQGVDAQGTASVKSDWSETFYFEADGSLPRPAFLKPSFPNPFNPETTLTYLVPEDLGGQDPLQLEIYSLRGEKVRTLEVDRTPGWHRVVWDGKDQSGAQAASGTYLSRYLAGTMVEVEKMTMLK